MNFLDYSQNYKKKYSSADPSKVQPGEIVRDCYCDSECIKWGDCCDDHKVFKNKFQKTR